MSSTKRKAPAYNVQFKTIEEMAEESGEFDEVVPKSQPPSQPPSSSRRPQVAAPLPTPVTPPPVIARQVPSSATKPAFPGGRKASSGGDVAQAEPKAAAQPVAATATAVTSQKAQPESTAKFERRDSYSREVPLERIPSRTSLASQPLDRNPPSTDASNERRTSVVELSDFRKVAERTPDPTASKAFLECIRQAEKFGEENKLLRKQYRKELGNYQKQLDEAKAAFKAQHRSVEEERDRYKARCDELEKKCSVLAAHLLSSTRRRQEEEARELQYMRNKVNISQELALGVVGALKELFETEGVDPAGTLEAFTLSLSSIRKPSKHNGGLGDADQSLAAMEAELIGSGHQVVASARNCIHSQHQKNLKLQTQLLSLLKRCKVVHDAMTASADTLRSEVEFYREVHSVVSRSRSAAAEATPRVRFSQPLVPQAFEDFASPNPYLQQQQNHPPGRGPSVGTTSTVSIGGSPHGAFNEDDQEGIEGEYEDSGFPIREPTGGTEVLAAVDSQGFEEVTPMQRQQRPHGLVSDNTPPHGVNQALSFVSKYDPAQHLESLVNISENVLETLSRCSTSLKAMGDEELQGVGELVDVQQQVNQLRREQASQFALHEQAIALFKERLANEMSLRRTDDLEYRERLSAGEAEYTKLLLSINPSPTMAQIETFQSHYLDLVRRESSSSRNTVAGRSSSRPVAPSYSGYVSHEVSPTRSYSQQHATVSSQYLSNSSSRPRAPMISPTE